MKSMAKFFICTVLFLISSALFSQNNGISKAYSFDIRKKIEPPLLAIEGLRPGVITKTTPQMAAAMASYITGMP